MTEMADAKIQKTCFDISKIIGVESPIICFFLLGTQTWREKHGCSSMTKTDPGFDMKSVWSMHVFPCDGTVFNILQTMRSI
jgi:hypothetical protein